MAELKTTKLHICIETNSNTRQLFINDILLGHIYQEIDGEWVFMSSPTRTSSFWTWRILYGVVMILKELNHHVLAGEITEEGEGH